MHRRTMLRSGSLALAGLALGCGTRRSIQTPGGAAPRLNLPPVRASLDRVIRTTVGLRPHRPSGFVLKAAAFDSKTVIHNYGHGGAGMSLAWGTGAMAADLALAHTSRRAAVLGCGSAGLSAARQLQRRGFEVTIYTLSVPPDTTSNMSMAGFTPTSGLVSADRRTPEWDAQFRQAAEISYRELQLLVGRDFGVYWMDSFTATDELPSEGGGADADLLPDHLRPNREREVFGPGEHPFPTKYAIRTAALSIEPSIYMDALMRDFVRFGGKIVIRRFDTPRDLMSLNEAIIVNSTGLGSKTLFEDEELVPVKGQLSVLIPQPEVNYRVAVRMPAGVQPAPNAGANPRSDGIVIGNLMERGNWSLEVDGEVRRRNVEAAARFFTAMRAPVRGVPLTRSTAPPRPPALESFFGEDDASSF